MLCFGKSATEIARCNLCQEFPPFCTAKSTCRNIINIREGWKTQARGKHAIKPFPTYDTISPPLCSRPVIFFRGNGHRPDQSHFLRPPKLVLEGALYSTFPPPPNRTIRFAPPHLRFPEEVREKYQRATTKGQNRFRISHTSSHFFQNFSPRAFPFKTKGFSSRRTKEKKI